MLFSIVIPTFRRPDALRISLSSLHLQNFPKNKFEVIVSNNSPEVGVEQIVSQFRCGGLNIVSIDESRPGAHFARNSGVLAAKGKYILFIDDDCEADGSLLENYQVAIEEFEPIIAAGRIDIRWDSTPPKWVIPFEFLMGKINFGPGIFWLKKGQSANGGNLLIQRDFFLQIGGMEPDQVGKLIFGSGDIALSLSANRLGHNVLWVEDAKVWHHQRREINAKLNDLLRREFNNGIMIAYELQKRNDALSMARLALISARLSVNSARQFLTGVVLVDQSFIARSLLILGKIVGMNWFYFFKSRVLRRRA